ncbi:unnamed protein product [Pleuronectes platessa]|uniref:Uncharacterized protein n=1 Tax=Pleuronectes platessa TaxID=8262 RepID=A0A9N7TJP7_PLEPL|nr:unnamed protein product [Pleuronectes platessa]
MTTLHDAVSPAQENKAQDQEGPRGSVVSDVSETSSSTAPSSGAAELLSCAGEDISHLRLGSIETRPFNDLWRNERTDAKGSDWAPDVRVGEALTPGRVLVLEADRGWQRLQPYGGRSLSQSMRCWMSLRTVSVPVVLNVPSHREKRAPLLLGSRDVVRECIPVTVTEFYTDNPSHMSPSLSASP